MSYTPFDQCARSVWRALETLTLLRQRRAITADTVADIRRHRRTADISLQSTFRELRRAFLTPIDRDEVLLLRQLTEQVATAAEDCVLSLYRSGHTALHGDAHALLVAVTDECTALHEALLSLSGYPRSDAILHQLTEAERRHRTTQETGAFPPLIALSAACHRVSEALRRILLTMT